jgi:hypothetical protein
LDNKTRVVGQLGGQFAMISTVPGRAIEVSRLAMFTTGPNTSPRRLKTRRWARSACTGSSR